jgi:UDP-glucose:(glucosyl)LPS alpha-1,2-glucosyltransferase
MNTKGVTQRPLAILLPRGESFQMAGAGAISTCVRDALGVSALRKRIKVLGEMVANPFDPLRFIPISLASWIYGRRTNRYVQGAISALREIDPAYIEIHNRPIHVAALRKAFPDVPILMYLHNDPRTMRGIRDAAKRQQCLEQVSAVVCVSDYIRSCMLDGLENHSDAGKVCVVLNGIDTVSICPNPATTRRKEFLFVGRLIPEKGGLLFAEAARALKDRLPDWRFTLIGAARSFGKGTQVDGYDERVIEAMKSLGKHGEISRYLPRAEVLSRLQLAAIAVIPSLWDDPCPLSVIEAMASGCAVAASPRGGIPQLLGEAGVFIDSNDVAPWSEGLLRLAQDDAQRQHYQEQARIRAVHQLDIHHTVARLDALRRELIDETQEGKL